MNNITWTEETDSEYNITLFTETDSRENEETDT